MAKAKSGSTVDVDPDTFVEETELPIDVDDEPEDETEEQRRERLNKATVALEWMGQRFVVPKRRGRWPVDAAREFNRNRVIEGLVALLGEDEWPRLRRVCPLLDDLNAFSRYAVARIEAEVIQ